MKTRLIIPAALLILMCTGCKKEQECAPLSWTDYNWVEDVHCNFTHNVYESLTHLGDTLKVFGWLFENDFPNSNTRYLISRKDMQFTYAGRMFYYPWVEFHVNAERFDSLMAPNPYEMPLYIKGVVRYWPDEEIGCFYLNDVIVNKTLGYEE
jgi:hypothetical protein